MRARMWIVVGAGIGLLLIGTATVVVHEMAPTRWPALAIRWSPSVDHVMRAGLAQARMHPAGIDAAWAEALTARFPLAALERCARRGGRPAVRAGFFLGARAAEPEAREAVLRLVADGDPLVRQSLAMALPAGDVSLPIIDALLAVEEREVVAAAAFWLRSTRHVGGTEVADATVDRLVPWLDATPRPAMVATGPDPWLIGDAPLPLRLQTASEAEASATELRAEAWAALAAIRPQRGLDRWRSRPGGTASALRVAQTLPSTGEAIPWLDLLAADPAVAPVAIRRLEQITLGLTKTGTGGRPEPSGWLVLHRLGVTSAIIDRERADGWRRLVALVQAATAEEREAILATLPEAERDDLRRASAP